MTGLLAAAEPSVPCQAQRLEPSTTRCIGPLQNPVTLTPAAMHVLQEIVQDGRPGPKAALKDLARQGAEGAEGLAEQAQQRLRERIAQEYGGPLDSVSCLCDLLFLCPHGRQPRLCALKSQL